MAVVYLLGLMLASLIVPAAAFPLSTTSGQSPALSVNSPLSWTFQGYNYPSWQSEEYASDASRVSLTDMRATGANYVAITPTQYMTRSDSVSFGPDPSGRTATDAAVIRAIDDAHARGLKVMLKPHVDVIEGDVWRGDIKPADTAAWFAAYQELMTHYARLSADHGVELLVVGTELASLSDDRFTTEWYGVIAGIKSVYNGPLTYSASLNEYGNIRFWDRLDYMGLNFYFPLSEMAEPGTTELVKGWTSYSGRYGQANWLSRVEAWQASWGKPVIFTEIGYRSIQNVGVTPWDYWTHEIYNGDNQARAYEAAFEVLQTKPWLAGVFWWNWAVGDSNGGAGDTGYTVHGKPAEAVLTSWFGRDNQPGLIAINLDQVYWASYGDYQAQVLSVSYNVRNESGERVNNSQVQSSNASNGVAVTTPMPLTLGSIEPGATASVRLAYQIPSGLSAFRAVMHLQYAYNDGVIHHYPVQ
ncbi:MAG: glycoside hydrolase family 113 [Thermoleophilia bacterium]